MSRSKGQYEYASVPPRGTVRKDACAGGFTLIELIVVIAIMVSLTLIAIPLSDGIEDAKETKVVADTTTIGGALLRYLQDTRLKPTGQLGQPTYDYLLGDLGSLPTVTAGGTAADLAVITRTDTWNNRRWRGPYLEPMSPDPWGNRYVAWVGNFHAGRPVWVLSAGPDGILQTGPTDTAVQGDDIGMSVE